MVGLKVVGALVGAGESSGEASSLVGFEVGDEGATWVGGGV